MTFNQWVTGLNPVGLTKSSHPSIVAPHFKLFSEQCGHSFCVLTVPGRVQSGTLPEQNRVFEVGGQILGSGGVFLESMAKQSGRVKNYAVWELVLAFEGPSLTNLEPFLARLRLSERMNEVTTQKTQ